MEMKDFITSIQLDERRVTYRRCIEALEYLHDYEAPHDAHREALWNAITALRALQEQP